ncbi:MAG: hypothetical protein IPO83_15200 [Chitinophagaceae bacterium]|nr:hypothetical protein [Chitinophagaceae bacterium]
MKNVFLAFFCFCLLNNSIPGAAQIVSKSYTSATMQAFIKGQTYAVLTTDETFNKWFQSTLEKQWTVNQLQFISAAKFDTFVISDKNFFIYAEAKDEKTSAIRLLTGDDIAKKKEFFFVLSQGGYKQAKLLLAAGTSGSKVLGSFRYGPDRADLCAGMIENEIMLTLLNQSLQVVMEKQIKSMVKDSVKWTISDENDRQIADQTLLINEAYNNGKITLDDKTIITEKVMEDYPYDYLVISKDSVPLLFDESTGNYAYLFFYFPSAHLKSVDDCGDIIVYDPFLKKILYYEDNMAGPWFEKWKMKQLATAIKSK